MVEGSLDNKAKRKRTIRDLLPQHVLPTSLVSECLTKTDQCYQTCVLLELH